jgi:hypothetical protein
MPASISSFSQFSILYLVGWYCSKTAGAETGQYVLVEISPVGLLCAGRQPARERKELLRPVGQRHVSVARVDPRSPSLVGLHFDEVPLCVGLSGEAFRGDPSERIAIASSVLPISLLDVAHLRDLLRSAGRAWGADGARKGAI